MKSFFSVHGFECEDSFQQTGTRKISTCPFGDQFCVTYESRYLVYEQGPDGNATGNVVWNVTEGKEQYFLMIVLPDFDLNKNTVDANPYSKEMIPDLASAVLSEKVVGMKLTTIRKVT